MPVKVMAVAVYQKVKRKPAHRVATLYKLLNKRTIVEIKNSCLTGKTKDELGTK